MTLLLRHLSVQFVGIGQIAIMSDADTVGVVSVKGLSFGTGGTSRRGVPDMAQSDVAPQLRHVMLQEDVLHQTIVLAEVEAHSIGRHHAGGILAAVLQDRQPVKQELIDLFVAGDDGQEERVTNKEPRLGIVVRGALRRQTTTNSIAVASKNNGTHPSIFISQK